MGILDTIAGGVQINPLGAYQQGQAERAQKQQELQQYMLGVQKDVSQIRRDQAATQKTEWELGQAQRKETEMRQSGQRLQAAQTPQQRRSIYNEMIDQGYGAEVEQMAQATAQMNTTEREQMEKESEAMGRLWGFVMNAPAAEREERYQMAAQFAAHNELVEAGELPPNYDDNFVEMQYRLAIDAKDQMNALSRTAQSTIGKLYADRAGAIQSGDQTAVVSINKEIMKQVKESKDKTSPGERMVQLAWVIAHPGEVTEKKWEESKKEFELLQRTDPFTAMMNTFMVEGIEQGMVEPPRYMKDMAREQLLSEDSGKPRGQRSYGMFSKPSETEIRERAVMLMQQQKADQPKMQFKDSPPEEGPAATAPVAPAAPEAQTPRGTQDNPHQPTTMEEYNQIKSGELFIHPDSGKLQVKP